MTDPNQAVTLAIALTSDGALPDPVNDTEIAKALLAEF